MGALEEVVLSWDARGVSALRPFLPDDFCTRAAVEALKAPERAFIATGFYIAFAGAPETDGPPGAVALGKALQALGSRVYYVTDEHCAPLLEGLAGGEVLSFPIAGPEESARVAREWLERYRPTLVVSVERCGANARGRYLNFRGQDITPYTARLDYLFLGHPHTVAVGDLGNEIGMGRLAGEIARLPGLPAEPCVTPCEALVVATTSNWGAYGVVAALSILTGRDLLPTPEEEAQLVRRCVELGAVDGTTGQRVPDVDGFPPERSAEVVRRLRGLVEGALR